MNFTRNEEGTHALTTRCSQLNQWRINFYWDKIERTCTNDINKMCVSVHALPMLCQTFFSKEEENTSGIVAITNRPEFFLLLSLAHSFIVYIFIMTYSRCEAYEARTFLPFVYIALVFHWESKNEKHFSIDACSICAHSSTEFNW